jgi:putative transposase
VASTGSVGDAYDNALMEPTIGLYKTEIIKPGWPWKPLARVGLATAEWVDWYCHRRLHGEMGHIPPVEYETNYCLTTTKPQSQQPPEISVKPGRFTAAYPRTSPQSTAGLRRT